jgi:hypothetical protein
VGEAVIIAGIRDFRPKGFGFNPGIAIYLYVKCRPVFSGMSGENLEVDILSIKRKKRSAIGGAVLGNSV